MVTTTVNGVGVGAGADGGLGGKDPITGTGLAPAATTAALEPGSMTPLMDRSGKQARMVGRARAVAVLQAMTTWRGLLGRR